MGAAVFQRRFLQGGSIVEDKFKVQVPCAGRYQRAVQVSRKGKSKFMFLPGPVLLRYKCANCRGCDALVQKKEWTRTEAGVKQP